MREDLLGYLLGALEPDEIRRVQRALAVDPALRAELAELERMLEPLHGESEILPEPPPDLVARTLAKLPPLAPLPAIPADSRDSELDDSATDAADVRLTPAADALSPDLRTWRDWFASVAAAGILAAIVIPSLIEGRFEARKRACQDHLRELGIAMNQFVVRNAQARLPSVDASGPRAFAGIYAPHLRQAGLLAGTQWIECPSWQPDEFWRSRGIEVDPLVPREVTLRMIDDAGPHASELAIPNPAMPERLDRLRKLQQVAGGHYAYTLGVQDGDYFTSPRFQGRASFAVMSDAVLTIASSTQDDANVSTVFSHGGRGINVLYEDGSVRFLNAESMGNLPDHPLRNHEGRGEAGVTIDDASLAPSWQPPFVNAVQR